MVRSMQRSWAGVTLLPMIAAVGFSDAAVSSRSVTGPRGQLLRDGLHTSNDDEDFYFFAFDGLKR
jgi:hypothetical protein